MKKNVKVIMTLLLFIMLVLHITYINAADINMNLSSNQENLINANENIVYDEDSGIDDDNNEITNTNTNNENLTNTNIQDTNATTPRVTSTSTTEDEDFLNAENIMSIIIIVIGILLLFLGGAILVRFK